MQNFEELIIKDKFTNLNQVSEVLKEEIETLSRNFFLLSDEVIVRYKRDKNNYVFNVEIPVSRIKPFGNRII
jgi:hypothetical protein